MPVIILKNTPTQKSIKVVTSKNTNKLSFFIWFIYDGFPDV